MTVTLLATECPAIVVPSTFVSISAAGSLAAGNAPVSESIMSGQTPSTPWTPMQRRNATRSDNMGRFGAGGYAIANGLTISVLTGLTLQVAAGLAMIDNAVAVESATPLAIPNNAAPAWVWLLQSGALTYALDTTAPASACCQIGNAWAVGNTITKIDTSGVMYLRGGHLWRETADSGPPGDTPPSTIAFFARTQGGLFYWDGSEYTEVSASVTDALLTSYALVDDLETSDRKFRALLRALVEQIGPDILITDELLDDFDLATQEGD